MSYRVRAFACAFIVVLEHASFGAFQDEETPVEPAELAKRFDLVGQKVSVDDHLENYINRTGEAPDELQLKRTRITFLVPRKLRPESKPRGVIVRGVLRRDGSRLVCDVSELKAVAGDLERVEAGVKGLSARDSETRKAWARWAETRGKDFKNEAVLKRGRELEAEAFRIETAMKRLGVDAPQEWLAMAKDARRRGVPEPEPAGWPTGLFGEARGGNRNPRSRGLDRRNREILPPSSKRA